MLGTEVEVPVLGGKAMLKVPALTQTDTKFRLKVKRLTNFQRYGKGDQHVCVKVAIPKKLSSKEKDLLLEFKGQSEKKSSSIWDTLRRR